MNSNLKNITRYKYYFDNIISLIVDSLIVADSEGKIEKLNQTTLNILGYQESELIGQSIQSILADSSLKVNDLIKTNNLNNYEVIYLTKNGTTIPIAFSSFVIYDRDDKAIGIVCIGRDMWKESSS